MWTHFWDVSSGGYQKEEFHHLYIELPKDQAKVYFYNRFGHNPERISCTCCGGDYYLDEEPSLEESTAHERDCEWTSNKEEKGGGHFNVETGETLEEFRKRKDILIITHKEIKEDELEGEVPEEGYVWMG